MPNISVSDVEGDVDYAKAMKEFGIDSFAAYIEKMKADKRIAKYMPPFYRRGLVIGHRDFEPVYQSLARKKPFAVLTGANPSGRLHIGNFLFLSQALFFQKLGAEVFIPISNDETYVFRKSVSLEQATANAFDEVIPSIIALGFDPKKTHIFLSTAHTKVYELAVKLSAKTTLSTIKAVFGFSDSDNPGQFFYSVVQSAHILLPQLYHAKIPTVVPIGLDQDPYMRLSRDVAERAGFVKPSSTYHSFISGLQGGKMSGSKPETCLYLDDSEEDAKRKIMRSFSGGAPSLEEHRKHGGNPDVDIAFQYLYYIFEESDSKIKELESGYRSGKVTTAEMKALLVKKACAFLREHRKKKAAAGKVMKKFMLN